MAGATSDDTALRAAEVDLPAVPVAPDPNAEQRTEQNADRNSGPKTGTATRATTQAKGGARAGSQSSGETRGLGFWALAGRHRPFAIVLTLGVLLRVCAILGFRPALFFNDSYDYLHGALYVFPEPLRPRGYSLLLLLLRPFHSFSLVVTVQHLMGVAMAVMIYALLRRYGLPGWGAALATVPVLLDAYQIQLEHLILSDVPFNFLVVSVVTLLLWRAKPSYRVAAGVGALLGIATLTRSVGLPVLLAVIVFMLLRRVKWRVIALTVVVCVVPMIGYSAWYASVHGPFAMTESSGIFLYARAYKFADCDKMKPPVEEIFLCVEPGNRLPFSQDGIWDRRSPLWRNSAIRFSRHQNELAGSFSKRAIRSQPGDYARVVAGDFLRAFRWERTVFPNWATYEQYEFGTRSRPLPDWSMGGGTTAAQDAAEYEQGPARPTLVQPFAAIMDSYQGLVYLRGTLLGVILLVGLGGLVPLWRRFGGAALLPWITATGLLLAPAATAEFDYRYVLPAVPLACMAAGLAWTSEVRAAYVRAAGRLRRRSAQSTAGDHEEPHEDDQSPLAASTAS